MSTENDHNEDTGAAEQQQAASSVDESGATQIADGATSGDEQGQTGETGQGGQGNQQQSKSQGTKQRLRRKLRESETEKAQLAEDNRKLHEKVDTLAEQVDGVLNPPLARPDRMDYESEEEYEDVLYDWRNQKAAESSKKSTESEQLAQTQTQKPGAQTQTQVSAEVQKVVDNWNDSCDDAAEKYDDFDQVTFKNTSLPITTMMRDALIESDNGGEVIYHLGKNEAEAERIAKLPLSSQVLAINELSKKFTSTTTEAPDPIETLKSGSAGSNKSTDPLLEGATFE